MCKVKRTPNLALGLLAQDVDPVLFGQWPAVRTRASQLRTTVLVSQYRRYRLTSSQEKTWEKQGEQDGYGQPKETDR